MGRAEGYCLRVPTAHILFCTESYMCAVWLRNDLVVPVRKYCRRADFRACRIPTVGTVARLHRAHGHDRGYDFAERVIFLERSSFLQAQQHNKAIYLSWQAKGKQV
jgi:hypothetical protein